MKISKQLEFAQAQEIRRRLKGYQQEDATKQRDMLVSEWRKHHPVAAGESSVQVRPLIQMAGYAKLEATQPDEYWHNDVYTVSVRRHKKDSVFGTDEGMIQLGISSLDGAARHDWRDFQAIKNQLCGDECEGFELYPAESRLLDPSNYYSLFCFPGIKRLKIGVNERLVIDSDKALAPQRAFPEKPTP